MNFVNLMETLKNQIDYDTFQELQNDFVLNDLRAARESLKPCKSTAAKAVKKYIAAASHKDEKCKGVYTEGHTVLIISADKPEAESKDIKTTNIAELVMKEWENKKPSDCYFLDSVALYKALKKQQKGEYLLHLDGHYYNAAYVAEMVECITVNKDAYISAEICERGMLVIHQNGGGTACILPVIRNGIHISKNINAREFFSYLTEIENKYIEEMRKTA